MIDRMRRWAPPMILAASALTGCSLGLDGLTFDRDPDGGATTGNGGHGGATTGNVGSTTGNGGHGGATATTGTTGTSAGGGLCAPKEALSDDFDNPATLSSWHLLSAAEQTPPLQDILDINATTPGQLTMRPMPTAMNGWYAEHRGPFLYKDVTGNFLVAARVSAGVLAGPGTAPTRTFNTAGLMARKPGAAPANWLLIDVGFQDPNDAAIGNITLGALGKRTLDGVTARTPWPGSHQGWLGICRIGDTFALIHKLDGELSATLLEQVDRPDLGATIQVGVVTGSWVPQQRDVVGRFDSVHFSVPSTPADCEACLLE
ncbi:MAG: hypothetical protein ABI193_14545 [Minicystis sp.]